MHDLIVGALQERRVDRAEGLHSVRGESGREGHRVLLRESYVEGPVRKDPLEEVHPGSGRHRGGDRADAVVEARLRHQGLGEHLREGGGIRAGRLLGPGVDVEARHPVVPVRGLLRRRIALSLPGADVDQDRTRGGIVAHVPEDGQKVVEVVAVDRPHVVEPQLLEQRAPGHEATGVFLGPPDTVLDHPREPLGRVPRDVADRAIALRRDEPREIAAHRPDRRGDRHLVVVEDDDKAGVHRPRVVQALVRHAAGERAVADDRDDPIPPALQIAGDGKPECRRDRGGCMRGAEGVVLALRALGEAGQPASLTEAADPRAPAGQDLVRIALMPDIPDEDVFGGIEQVVQGHRQLDDPNPRSEVTAGVGDRIDRLGAELLGEELQLPHGHPPQIVGPIDEIQMGRFDGHDAVLVSFAAPGRTRRRPATARRPRRALRAGLPPDRRGRPPRASLPPGRARR